MIALWLALAVLAVLIVYRWASIPQTKGTMQLARTMAGVEILRDRYAVPHIFASTQTDAHFALGLVHAQDRLWQLEFNRRVINGELSQLLGPSTVPIDRMMRVLGLKQASQSAWAALPAESQRELSAYVDGLNQGIALAKRRPWLQSLEFWLLNAAPQPWTAADVLAMLKLLSLELSTNMNGELLRLALLERLRYDQVTELFDLPNEPLPSEVEWLYKGLAPSAAALLQALPAAAPDGIGSNHWLADARRSVSARPILANDPHLSFSAPAVWYLAQMSAPGLEVIGATIPGLPFVLLGRGDRLAWGLTNNGADVQDLFIEQRHPDRPDEYRTGDGWAAFAIRDEIIAVKGEPNVRLQVRTSRHGPIVSDVLTSAAAALKNLKLDSTHVLALSWSGLAPLDQTADNLLRVNRARSAKELISAVDGIAFAPQNLLYADAEGKTGMLVVGAIPRRDPNNRLSGRMPAPGWLKTYDWLGHIAADEQLSLKPIDGTLGNANQAPSLAGYRHFLSSEWSLPYRQQRIEQLLIHKRQHDSDSFAQIQNDVLSLGVKDLLAALLQVPAATEGERAVIERLRRWDAVMSADAAEPLIAAAWIEELYRLVFQDELGELLYPRFSDYRHRSLVLLKTLQGRSRHRWCDRQDTDQSETCEQMIGQALSLALTKLRQRFGDDESGWRWGQAHMAVSEHRPFGRHPWLSKLFDIRVETGGDAFTVNAGRAASATAMAAADPFENRWGASYRAIYDLSDPDKSRYMMSTGQSGHLLSPHYRDLSRLWARAEYIPMASSRIEVERQTAARLTLVGTTSVVADR